MSLSSYARIDKLITPETHESYARDQKEIDEQTKRNRIAREALKNTCEEGQTKMANLWALLEKKEAEQAKKTAAIVAADSPLRGRKPSESSNSSSGSAGSTPGSPAREEAPEGRPPSPLSPAG